MSNITQKDMGLYEKFSVHRNDGRDSPGEKHHGCWYFVLDTNHDPHAIPALRAYVESCRVDFPYLAEDLEKFLDSKTGGGSDE